MFLKGALCFVSLLWAAELCCCLGEGQYGGRACLQVTGDGKGCAGDVSRPGLLSCLLCPPAPASTPACCGVRGGIWPYSGNGGAVAGVVGGSGRRPAQKPLWMPPSSPAVGAGRARSRPTIIQAHLPASWSEKLCVSTGAAGVFTLTDSSAAPSGPAWGEKCQVGENPEVDIGLSWSGRGAVGRKRREQAGGWPRCHARLALPGKKVTVTIGLPRPPPTSFLPCSFPHSCRPFSSALSPHLPPSLPIASLLPPPAMLLPVPGRMQLHGGRCGPGLERAVHLRDQVGGR